MKGVAARYPAFDKTLGRPVDLEQRINLEREHGISRRRRSPYESHDLLALSAFVADQSRGMPITAGDDPAAEALRRARAATCSCSARASSISPAPIAMTTIGTSASPAPPITQGQPTGYPIYRLEWQIAGLAGAAPAQLHHRRPRPGLRLRRAGDGRARALSDVARARHDDGDAGGAAVSTNGRARARPHRARDVGLFRRRGRHLRMRDVMLAGAEPGRARTGRPPPRHRPAPPPA